MLRDQVPGDLLEAGVWRGGIAIFMRGVLKANGGQIRRVWVADSFEGLPRQDRGQDKAVWWWRQGDMAVSLEIVKANFARFGLLDDQVRFLRGYFSDILPMAPIDNLAILRIDADLCTSTRDVLIICIRSFLEAVTASSMIIGICLTAGAKSKSIGLPIA